MSAMLAGHCSSLFISRASSPRHTTCAGIANMTGWPVPLIHFIPVIPAMRLSPWQWPCGSIVPGYKMCLFSRPGCGRGYVVRPGDTCASISAANGLTEAQLQELNPAMDCGDLVSQLQALCVAPLSPGEVRLQVLW
jgi:hypothetical protein